MLDAYASYQLSKNLKLSVEANNLLRTKRTSYYAVDNLPRGTYADDRRFGLSLMAEM
jgi:outer membrane receptor protein involved in Fe transport